MFIFFCMFLGSTSVMGGKGKDLQSRQYLKKYFLPHSFSFPEINKPRFDRKKCIKIEI